MIPVYFTAGRNAVLSMCVYGTKPFSYAYNFGILIENKKNTTHNDLYIFENAMQKRALSTRRDLLNVYYYHRVPNNIIGYRINVGYL